MDCEHSRALVAGLLLSNSSDFASDVMDDVFDSLLYAQLYAEKETSKFDHPAQWLIQCDNALKIVKWTLSERQRQAYEPDQDELVSIELLIEKCLLSRLPATQARLVKSLMDSVVGLSESSPASLLLHRYIVKSATDTQGHSTIVLQVGTLSQSAHLSLLSLTFTTKCAVNADFLHQVFLGRTIVGEVDVRYATHTWSHDDYKGVRERVIGVLVGRRDGLILPVGCNASEVDTHGK